MVKVPTVKIALVCAGLMAFGQSAEASTYRTYRKVLDTAKECVVRLVQSYHEGRAAYFKARMANHSSEARAAEEYMKNPSPELHHYRFEGVAGPLCARAGLALGGVGLVGYGITKLPQDKVSDYAHKAIDGSLKAGGGLVYAGVLLPFPWQTLLATGVLGGFWKIYSQVKAQRAQKPKVEEQRS